MSTQSRGKAKIMVGAYFAIPLRPKLFGICRIVGKNRKYGFIIEGVNWFGSRVPTLKDIERAAPLRDPIEAGRMARYFLMDSPNHLPKGYASLGQSQRSFRSLLAYDGI